MRTLLIFGGLAVCVLLVTPSHGDRTEDGGGKNGISNLREFIGQNEDGRANVIEADSRPAIDQQALPRSRRQEPPGTSKARKRKPCIGCFTALETIDDEPRRSRKIKKNKGTSTPPLPGMYGLMPVPGPDTSQPLSTRRGEGRRGRKKNGGKRRHKEKGAGKTWGRHHRPEREKEEKIKRHSGGQSLLASSRYGGREEDLGGGMEKGEGKTRSRHHHHPESEKEEEASWRYGARSHATSSRYGGRKEDLGDGTEAAERKRRQSDKSKKGHKQTKRSGSRSLISAGRPVTQLT